MFIASIFLLVGCATLALSQNACQTQRLEDAKSGAAKWRGTNLGSWFVMEGWMAGSVWSSNGCDTATAQGSYMLEKCLGDRASAALEKHWSSWITEDTFADMSRHGVNVVRIPVGWWNIYDPVGGADNADLNYYITPKNYAVGGLKYLDQAFEWGRKYGIGILVDMHAAPGSQNGFDNSSPSFNGEVDWDKYPANVGQTVDSMELYAERYAGEDALVGFCLLNEPKGMDIGVLQDYYKRAYEAIRRHSPDSWIILNPLVNGESGTESHWTGFMNPDAGYNKVGMDLHYYSCFGSAGDQSTAAGCIGYINWDRKNQISDYMSKNPKPMMIGEWSGCFHAEQSRVGDFIQAQVDVYNTANLGWTFWSWTDGSPGNSWSLQTAFNQWIANLPNAC